jgi:hypothetical protein
MDRIAPLAPSLPPSGAGAHRSTSALPLPENSARLGTGNTASSERGRHSGGAKPEERHHKKEMNSPEHIFQKGSD